MINFTSINTYEINTSRFSNLLHDNIVREFEERFAEYVGAKYACSANSASSLIFLAAKKCPGIFEIPSVIPNVVPNALINADTQYRFRDDVDWVGGSYSLCYSRPLGVNIIDSAQKVERNQFKNEARPKDWMVFSFYPTKPVGGCDGGMIVSDDKDVVEWFRVATMNGTSMSHNNWEREIKLVGWKLHMNSIQAFIANENLKRLDEKQERLGEIRDCYNRELGTSNTSNHLFRISVSDNNSFIQEMRAKNITCGIHYRALHKHKIYSERYINQDSYFPKSDYEEKHTVSIPFHENLSVKDMDYITECINASTCYIR